MEYCDIKNVSSVNKVINGKTVRPGKTLEKVPIDAVDNNEVLNNRIKVVSRYDDAPDVKPERKQKKESHKEVAEDNKKPKGD